MKVLAIDTATDRLGVAVVADSRVLAEATYNMGRRHGELLAVVVDETLARLGLTVAALDGLAVNIGPGSFTGIRIGLALAKALSFASGVPLSGITSLDALAAASSGSAGLAAAAAADGAEGGTVLALLDARRGDAYAAAYRLPRPGHASDEPLLGPVVAPLAAWLQQAATLPGPHWVTGDGATTLWPAVRQALPTALPVGPLQRYVRPAVLAWLGQQRLAAGVVDEAATLVPLYLRRPPVEENA